MFQDSWAIGPIAAVEVLFLSFSIGSIVVACKLWKKAGKAKVPRITSGIICNSSDPNCDESVCYCEKRK